MEAQPTVTVVVACLNGVQTLPRLFDSLARQGNRDFELVMVDGGSTDGSLALFDVHSSAIAALVSEQDGGIYHAWNKGVTLGQGRYFLFLGADDFLWDDAVLERIAPLLTAPKERRGLVYGQVALIDEHAAELGRIGQPWRIAAPEAAHSMPLPFPGCFVAAELFERYGAFDPSFRIAGDFEWLLRVLADVEPHFVADVVVSGMGAGGVSNRPANERQRFAEDLRALQQHGRLTGYMAVARFRLLGWLRLAMLALFGPQAARGIANWGRRLRGRPLLPKAPW